MRTFVPGAAIYGMPKLLSHIILRSVTTYPCLKYLFLAPEPSAYIHCYGISTTIQMVTKKACLGCTQCQLIVSYATISLQYRCMYIYIYMCVCVCVCVYYLYHTWV